MQTIQQISRSCLERDTEWVMYNCISSNKGEAFKNVVMATLAVVMVI